ncbi:MAG: hypothetical protein M3460_09795 [Actinomycetota bacterium]|nr:hypothetical protein [Actinomycetota bacterium]
MPAVRGTAALHRPPARLPSQWETWYAAIRQAMTRQAITEHNSHRTTHHLVHAHCARRHPDDKPHGTDQ